MFTVREILEATAGRLIRGDLKGKVSGVSIDSRTVRPNELFVAIKGSHFDGHNFITQAIQRGAGAILFSNSRYKTSISARQADSISILKVKDTVWALSALAGYHRERFKIPVIAITGSNGKTTTKDMISAILRTRFKVLQNPGTQNNHIGVPLALLRLRQKHQIAVIEIGANHAGEIDRLSRITKPTVGIITNIGPAHLEFFKSLQGVFKAKQELIENLSQKGKIIINQDDRFLSQLNRGKLSKVTFGLYPPADFCAQIIEQTKTQTTFLLNRRHYITLKVVGRHNVYNALASIACAREFGVSYNKIKRALALFEAPPMRMQMFSFDNVKIINDCYNSNPESLRCALDFLSRYSSRGRKIIVCGDMLELGHRAKRIHSHAGKQIAKSKIDFLITVGTLAKNIASGAHLAGMSQSSIRVCRNTTGASKCLRRLIRRNDSVLIKGSRAMQMEKISACFINSSIH